MNSCIPLEKLNDFQKMRNVCTSHIVMPLRKSVTLIVKRLDCENSECQGVEASRHLKYTNKLHVQPLPLSLVRHEECHLGNTWAILYSRRAILTLVAETRNKQIVHNKCRVKHTLPLEARCIYGPNWPSVCHAYEGASKWQTEKSFIAPQTAMSWIEPGPHWWHNDESTGVHWGLEHTTYVCNPLNVNRPILQSHMRVNEWKRRSIKSQLPGLRFSGYF